MRIVSRSERERETWYIIYMYMYIHTYIVCFEGKKKAQKFHTHLSLAKADPSCILASRFLLACRSVVEMDRLPVRRLKLSKSCLSSPVLPKNIQQVCARKQWP